MAVLAYMIPYSWGFMYFFEQLYRTSFRYQRTGQTMLSVLRDTLSGMKFLKSSGLVARQERAVLGSSVANLRQGALAAFWHVYWASSVDQLGQANLRHVCLDLHDHPGVKRAYVNWGVGGHSDAGLQPSQPGRKRDDVSAGPKTANGAGGPHPSDSRPSSDRCSAEETPCGL